MALQSIGFSSEVGNDNRDSLDKPMTAMRKQMRIIAVNGPLALTPSASGCRSALSDPSARLWLLPAT